MYRAGLARRLVSLFTVALLVVVTLPAAPAAAAALEVDFQPQHVFAADGAPSDDFGGAVGIWGDTAIVGASGHDTAQGAAYVYQRIGRYWTYTQTLVAPDGADDDCFGSAIALEGDTAFIGAAGDDAWRGAVYVFTRSGGTWSYAQKLVASDGVAGQEFGMRVALSGATAIMGAHNDDVRATDAGAAYIFTRVGGTWGQRAKLYASDAAARDFFGCSVALKGGTALVGAHYDDTAAGLNAGSTYVFTGSGSTWTERARLSVTGGVADDHFGSAVALEDGTALISATGYGSYGGAAYVFTGSGGTWTQRTKIVAPDVSVSSFFGHAVGLSGGTALITRLGDDQLTTNAGAAYVYTGSGATWTLRKKILADDGAAFDSFGTSGVLSGGTALIGANLDDTGAGTDAGSAYFHSFTTALTPGVTRIAGTNRYLTGVAASKRGFPLGAAAVVIATGENWPDALGGSALAGAAHGPLLLTKKDYLPAEVTAEVKRLGAVKAYVLGSTDAVSSAVETALVGMLGRANVVRLGGLNRYETARMVADKTIALLGASFGHQAFVATGLNYPDAVAASPIAAWSGKPILLANVKTGTVSVPSGVTDVIILGSEAAVPTTVESYLAGVVADVDRIGGINRYDTAARVAEYGWGICMRWNGVGLATGLNFPDALAAGPMLATNSGVLLLTRPDLLSGEAKAKLTANAASISSMFIFGDTNAVSLTVENAAKAAAGL